MSRRFTPRVQSASDSTHTWHCGATASLGTPAYMAPEQLDESTPATDRVDVYAVGVMLFSLVSGALPFEKVDMFGALMERRSKPAPRLRTLAPTVPDVIDALVANCLQRDPNPRPSPREVADVLAKYADQHGTASLAELECNGKLCDLDTVSAPIATLRSLPIRKTS
jgi:serine/threonine protein kinase